MNAICEYVILIDNIEDINTMNFTYKLLVKSAWFYRVHTVVNSKKKQSLLFLPVVYLL